MRDGDSHKQCRVVVAQSDEIVSIDSAIAFCAGINVQNSGIFKLRVRLEDVKGDSGKSRVRGK